MKFIKVQENEAEEVQKVAVSPSPTSETNSEREIPPSIVVLLRQQFHEDKKRIDQDKERVDLDKEQIKQDKEQIKQDKELVKQAMLNFEEVLKLPPSDPIREAIFDLRKNALNFANQQLEKSEKQLEKSEKELEDSKQQLKKSEKELEDSKRQLKTSEERLEKQQKKSKFQVRSFLLLLLLNE